MFKVFEDFDLTRVGHFQSALAAAGIRTLLKNQFMSSVMGEIPFVEVMPELWVLEEADLPRAQALIEKSLSRIHSLMIFHKLNKLYRHFG